jgi:MTH538 TIR-like domain (DUF1863)
MSEYSIFISHSHDLDCGHAMRLSAELAEYPRFTLRDNSIFAPQRITEEQPKPAIEQKIKQSDILIVISRPQVGRSEWVQFELDTAKKYGVPIIAIRSPDVPSIAALARERSDKIFLDPKWDVSKIVDAIRDLKKKRKPVAGPAEIPTVELPVVDWG